ncbi:MAG: DUF4418 family protein [Clostridiales bacterium]|jgi:hypothetical protein|nr:DUF4418 family protein [Clostridiales bacterium]
MKNRLIAGPLAAISGLLVAIGPQTMFKICDPSHHSVSNCFWTGQALIGVGSVLATLGVIYIFIASQQTRAGLSLAIASDAVLAFLIANVLIGMDSNPMMACRTTTLPILNIISVLTFVFAIGNTIYLAAKGRVVPANEAADSL